MKSINKNLNIQQTSILSVLNSDPNIYTISSEYGEITTRLMWIQESNMLKKVWQFDIDLTESWYSVSIDAQTGNVIQQIDWVSDVEAAKSYKYKVFPLGTNDPTQGDPVTITNPANHQASKNGWHFSNKEYKTTIGNNVFAQDNVDGGNSHLSNHRPESKKFSFVYDYEVQKGPKSYIDMSITNLFYWCNTIHDLFYLYGFDEQSGNFQTVNEAGKGKGSDAVIANAQDGSGTNNANFATPPDGRPGRMRYLSFNI